jgi:outer membrane protein TolC
VKPLVCAVLLVSMVACQSAPPQRRALPLPPASDIVVRLKPEPLPTVPVLGAVPVSLPQSLELDTLLRSVETHFPLVLAALEEYEIARGRVQQAQGGFDTRLGSQGKLGLEGYYENERGDFSVDQPIESFGATLSGGYRIGTGKFGAYDDDARTDEGGEFRLGVLVPMLQGFSIDPRRVALWQARIGEEQAEPIVTRKRLEATRKAAETYWKWVGSGRKLAIARRQLDLALGRQEQVRILVDEGQIAAINLVDNQRLIVERQAALVRAERGLQESAILLSLYWRGIAGEPQVPADALLPGAFPEPRAPEDTLIKGDIALALGQRPELRAIDLERSQMELELALSENQMLPALDLGMYASQDVGTQSGVVDDRGPFELQALFKFSLPLQRSRARGKILELEAKLAKLAREKSWVGDVVASEVRDASSALEQSYRRLALARENVTLALQLEDAERVALDEGQSDLFRLNLREQQTASAQSSEVDSQGEYFKALTDYRAVLGITYDEVVPSTP